MERNKSDGLNNNILQSFWVFFPWPMPFFKGNNPYSSGVWCAWWDCRWREEKQKWKWQNALSLTQHQEVQHCV